MIRSSALALADQAVWALTNFAAVAFAGHLLTGDQFGLFGVGLSVMVVASGLGAATGGEALAIGRGRAHLDGKRLRRVRLERQRSRAIGAVLSFGGLAPLLVCGALLAFSGSENPQEAWWVVVAAGPAVVADGFRSISYAERRASRALCISVTWALAQVLLTGFAWIAQGELTGDVALGAWSGGALVAAVVGVCLNPGRPSFTKANTDERRRRRSFGFEFLATAGASHLTVVLAAGLAGLESSGALRALQTVYGPVNVMLVGIRNAVVPAAAHERSMAVQRRMGMLVSAAAAAATGSLALVLALVPLVGATLMGDNWPRDVSLLLGFSLGRVVVGVVLGALVIFRASDRTAISTRLRTVSALALLIPFAAFAPASIEAALWASSIGSAVAALAWWWFALRDSRGQHHIGTSQDQMADERRSTSASNPMSVPRPGPPGEM